MRSPDEFDAFYKDARERLLVQTYALTGDLPAARSAVRDAFVIAWHHWRKASREDPEAWTRPHAWSHALRRHAARPWRKEKGVDPEVRATLDALAALSTDERRILLLTLLTDGTPDQVAREIGVTRQRADQLLRSATSQLALARDVPPSQVGQLLTPLAQTVAEVRFPRSTIIRRSGATRRRLHTTVGVLGTVAVLLVSGAAVTDTEGVHPALDRGVVSTDPSTSSEPPAPRLVASDMLTTADFQAALPAQRWSGSTPNANTDGDGSALPCQRARYADPRSSTYLVKDFTAQTRRGNPRRTGIQTVEASDRDGAAQRAYRTTLLWFASCTESRTQLISTHRIRGVGDQAMLLVLRDWNGPVTRSAAVARTGRFTTALVTTASGVERPSVRANARLLGQAINRLCHLPQAGDCASRPELNAVAPVPVGIVPAMLSEVDLPPVGNVRKPWVGTAPRQVRQNFAATRCDEATFRGQAWSNSSTRGFLIPGARLPATFGLTQTVGALRPERARAFVADVRNKMRTCPERDPGTEVDLVLNRSAGPVDLSVWHVTVEIADNTAVRYLMALVRRGGAVSQIGFVPAPRVQMADGAFVALAERALARLRQLPVPGS